MSSPSSSSSSWLDEAALMSRLLSAHLLLLLSPSNSLPTMLSVSFSFPLSPLFLLSSTCELLPALHHLLSLVLSCQSDGCLTDGGTVLLEEMLMVASSGVWRCGGEVFRSLFVFQRTEPCSVTQTYLHSGPLLHSSCHIQDNPSLLLHPSLLSLTSLLSLSPQRLAQSC